MELVRFAAFRQYELIRTEASSAIMGLLAGTQMAAHMLQRTEGPDRLLPEIFPEIPHIGRVNLRAEAAREILTAGEDHLGAMAVPYVLAIHEDYLKTCLTLLERAMIKLKKRADDLRLVNQHEAIEGATGKSFTTTSLQQLHTLRLMRNCTIHSGGRVDSPLATHLDKEWTHKTEAGWVNLTRRTPRTLKVGDSITFRHGEILIAIAVSKTLARQANRFLQPALPRHLWADLVVEDLDSGTSPGMSAPDFLRRANGYARWHYAPIQLTATEIADAVRRRTAGK